MSDLIAVTYPDEATAQQVRDTLIQLQRGHVIQLADVVVVTKNDKGKVKLHQVRSSVGLGAAGGALWGTLIGMLFFAPLLGAAVGAASGAAAGAVTDLGVDDNFMRNLGEKLTPGAAAVIALVVQSTPDKVLPEIAKFGGHVLQTSLSNEAEQQLQEALDAGVHPAEATVGS